MKVSIVIAYYNRRNLFIKTLESITNTQFKGSFEIVVVDDASTDSQHIIDLPKLFPKLNLKVVQIDKKNKWWVNPCIPNNIGFEIASGDVIIIQNPECLHVGDVIDYTAKNIVNNKYIVFGCYAIDKSKNSQLSRINGRDTESIVKTINPINNTPLGNCGSMNRWYQHSEYSDRCYNFCTAINKEDLNDLGGFDEEYAKGISCDDVEFLVRIKKKDMNIEMVDKPFVIHQWHPYTNYSDKKLVQQNRNLYFNKTIPSTNFRVNNRYTKELVEKLI